MSAKAAKSALRLKTKLGDAAPTKRLRHKRRRFGHHSALGTLSVCCVLGVRCHYLEETLFRFFGFSPILHWTIHKFIDGADGRDQNIGSF